MNHLSLFSGIGGLDLAAEWAGFRTIGFVERDRYCQRVLRRHWPGVPIWDDVAEVTADSMRQRRQQIASSAHGNEGKDEGRPKELYHKPSSVGENGRIGLVTGGFPCQPHSVAGKRKASGDERDLWGECARIAGELRPAWCVWENVPGLLSSESGHFFARVLGDMAALGYVVGWATYGAVDVGAPHRRDRVFIVCHLADAGRRRSEEPLQQWRHGDQTGKEREAGIAGSRGAFTENVADAGSAGCQERDPAAEPAGPGHGSRRSDAIGSHWQSEPDVGRVAHGVRNRVDRLRALGNAVVPQQAYPIFRAIAEYEGLI